MKLNLEIETARSEVNAQLIKEAASCTLYYKGTLSSKEACDMIGITRYEFEEILSQQDTEFQSYQVRCKGRGILLSEPEAKKVFAYDIFTK